MVSSPLMLRALLPLLLLAVPATGVAELYRWVDESGRVHYSDKPPPPNARSERELGAPRSGQRPGQGEKKGASGPKTYVEQEAEFRKRQVEKAEQQAAEQKAREEAETKRRNCERARAQLAGLQTGGRIARYNAQGERQFLNDAEIAAETQRAQQSVKDWCG